MSNVDVNLDSPDSHMKPAHHNSKPSGITLWDTTKVPAGDKLIEKKIALVALQARRKAGIVKENTPTGLTE
jgi:hypothetical protein